MKDGQFLSSMSRLKSTDYGIGERDNYSCLINFPWMPFFFFNILVVSDSFFLTKSNARSWLTWRVMQKVCFAHESICCLSVCVSLAIVPLCQVTYNRLLDPNFFFKISDLSQTRKFPSLKSALPRFFCTNRYSASAFVNWIQRFRSTILFWTGNERQQVIMNGILRWNHFTLRALKDASTGFVKQVFI